jgi:hypothetical protein
MKYPTPTTTIECSVSGCGFFDEIELERIPVTEAGQLAFEAWVMPSDWDEGWTVKDGGAVCPNHEDEPEETLSAAERNRGLIGGQNV